MSTGQKEELPFTWAGSGTGYLILKRTQGL